MNLSHNHEVVERALAPFATNVELVIEEPEPYGSGGTLAVLKGRFSGAVLTRNADHLSDLSLSELMEAHAASGALATLAVAPVEEGADLIVDDHGVKLVDRREASHAGFMWIGTSVFEASTIDLIGDQRPLDLARGLVAPLIARGEVSLHVHEGYQLDVGTPTRYLQASLDVLYYRAPAPPISAPGQFLEVEGGRAYLGPGAYAAPDSLSDGAVVLANARLEDGATVRQAIVWPGSIVPAGTRVHDGIWHGTLSSPNSFLSSAPKTDARFRKS